MRRRSATSPLARGGSVSRRASCVSSPRTKNDVSASATRSSSRRKRRASSSGRQDIAVSIDLDVALRVRDRLPTFDQVLAPYRIQSTLEAALLAETDAYEAGLQ